MVKTVFFILSVIMLLILLIAGLGILMTKRSGRSGPAND
jgi:hypothetical protein